MQNRASQKTRQKYSVGPQKGSATNSAGADQTMYFSGPFLCTFYLTNTEIGQYKYNCSADAVDVSVEIDDQLLHTTELWCVEQHITVNQLLLAFIRFCGNQSNWGVASDWLEACMRKFGEVLA